MSYSKSAAPVRIVAFGEILWDLLPNGKKLGGAPVNFLYHSQTLGADVRALTRIGDDQLGREIRERLAKLGLSTDFLQTSKTAPTGTVAVTLDADGTPMYEIVKNVAWDEIEIDDATESAIVQFLTKNSKDALSVFYFGSLALRSKTNRRSLRRILAALPSNVIRFCDLNLRASFFSREIVEEALVDADAFKLNDSEAILLAELFAPEVPNVLLPFVDSQNSLRETQTPEVRAALNDWTANLRRKFGLKTFILTCGSRGAFLFNGEKNAFAPSVPVKINDSVGAGDSFAAVCVVGLLQGVPEEKIVAAASNRAAFVCSQAGATPTIPPELLDAFAE